MNNTIGEKEAVAVLNDMVRISLPLAILTIFAIRHSYLMYLAKMSAYLFFNLLRFALLQETGPSLGIVFLALGHNGLTLIKGWNTFIYVLGAVCTSGQFLILLGIPKSIIKYVCDPISENMPSFQRDILECIPSPHCLPLDSSEESSDIEWDTDQNDANPIAPKNYRSDTTPLRKRSRRGCPGRVMLRLENHLDGS